MKAEKLTVRTAIQKSSANIQKKSIPLHQLAERLEPFVQEMVRDTCEELRIQNAEWVRQTLLHAVKMADLSFVSSSGQHWTLPGLFTTFKFAIREAASDLVTTQRAARKGSGEAEQPLPSVAESRPVKKIPGHTPVRRLDLIRK